MPRSHPALQIGALRPLPHSSERWRDGYGCGSSVRYLGANSCDFFTNSACSFSSSCGGVDRRVGTGTPTWAKRSSCPAGAQMQSSRAALPDKLVKECGALAGMLTVWPACTVVVSPRKVASISPSKTVKDSSKSCRCGGGPPPGRDVHVDEGITAVGVGAGKENGVGVSYESEVGQAFVGIGPSDFEAAGEVVGRERRDGLSSEGVLGHIVVGLKLIGFRPHLVGLSIAGCAHISGH